MPENIKQTVLITALLKGVLNGYPDSAAIFREYLQNSDDAGATHQTFVLDERSHPNRSLLDPSLAGTQGPALLAWNNCLLSEKDWKALTSIHSSSKSGDETQTGKNGLGFRASYHLTENPQILSGHSLLVLDAHEEFHPNAGGCQINIVKEGPDYADQLAAFGSLVNNPFEEFDGTVFRLPFRTNEQAQRSRIKNTPTSASDVYNLLIDFANNDLEEAILFLKHITTIEIRHITSDTDATIAIVIAEARPNLQVGKYSRTVEIQLGLSPPISRRWLFFSHSVPRATASSLLSKRLKHDVSDFMTVEKLVAEVEIALIPAVATPPISLAGRLFTLLPLPVRTGFPVHLNAVFALAPDRQSLKNIEEEGRATSRERRLVGWNRMIFDVYAVQAWAMLLEDLACQGHSNIWSAWPSQVTDPNMYWSSIIGSLLKATKDKAVFPVFGSQDFDSLTNPTVLVTSEDTSAPLRPFSEIGLRITSFPSHLFPTLKNHGTSDTINFLSPKTTHDRLLQTAIRLSDTTDLEGIIDYLVFSGGGLALENLIDLPFFKFASGERTSLGRPGSQRLIVPGSEEETELFASCDNLLAWPCGSDKLRKVLSLPQASRIVNVSRLAAEHVITFLTDRFSQTSSNADEIPAPASDTEWLVKFWIWLTTWRGKDQFLENSTRLNDLFILPTTNSTIRRWSSQVLFDVGSIPSLVDEIQAIGISTLDNRLASNPQALSLFLGAKAAISSSSADYPAFLSRNLDNDMIGRLPSDFGYALRTSLNATVALCTSISPNLGLYGNLRLLPIFSTRSRNVTGDLNYGPIRSVPRYVKVDRSIPMPTAPSPVPYIDMADSVTYVVITRLFEDARKLHIHDDVSILTQAIDDWELQDDSLRDTFIEKIFDNVMKFPEGMQERLKNLPFITVEGSETRQPPNKVLEPRSTVAQLYAGEHREFYHPSGQFASGKYLELMKKMKFLRSKLDLEIVQERLSYLVLNPDASSKAGLLINALNRSWHQDYYGPVRAYRGQAWLPVTLPQLDVLSPAACRDDHNRVNHRYLYDYVLTVLSRQRWSITSDEFRMALGWSEPVPMESLTRQILRTLEGRPSDLRERLRIIIDHLSNRNLSEAEIGTLRSTLIGQSWIPVSSYGPRLDEQTCTLEYATLQVTGLGHPFYHVQGANDPKCANFFMALGCHQRPPLQLLFTELNRRLSTTSPSTDTQIATSVRILQEIANYHPPVGDVSYLVPGADHLGHPASTVYYPDLGDPLVEAADSIVSAHPQISFALAEKLGIPVLSSLKLGNEDEDDKQMKGDLCAIIRNFLRENSVEFAFNEWLANAHDAGATRFSMVLDHRGLSNRTPISPRMGELHGKACLILYNNAVFKEADLDGIRDVDIGGKRGSDRAGTHGRYGRGALSLYYFSNLPIIISGRSVLFLDPAEKHLPPKGRSPRATLRKSLSFIKSTYPGFFDLVEGLFGFNLEADCFKGTFFILPLFTTIFESETPTTATNVRKYITGTYAQLASDSFFFTGLHSISASERTKHTNTLLWEVSIERTAPSPIPSHPQFRIEGLTRGTERWLIASSSNITIPRIHQGAAADLKLDDERPLDLKIAIELAPRSTEEKNPKNHLFSTVRLPKKTYLPFHVHSTFFISSNRQDVVYHAPGADRTRDSKSAYNAWIFNSVVPPLYLALLDHLNQEHTELVTQHHRRWFPTDMTRDDISDSVGRAFVEQVTTSAFRLFQDVNGIFIPFQDCIFSEDEPKDLVSLLRSLRLTNYVANCRHTPMATHRSATKMTGSLLLSRVSQHAVFSSLSQLVRDGRVTREQLVGLASFIVSPSSPLVGLPILTSNGTLRRVAGLQGGEKIYVAERQDVVELFSTSTFLALGSYHAPTVDALVRDPRSNILRLDKSNVISLVAVEVQRYQSDETSFDRWCQQLWDLYNYLPGPPPIPSLQRDGLNLIKTNQGYVSVGQCSPETILHFKASEEEWMSACMTLLGFQILAWPDRTILRRYIDVTFPQSLLVNFVQCLHFREYPTSFADTLEPAAHVQLATWLRRELSNITSLGRELLPYKDALSELPIWKGRQGKGERLLPASRLKILPRGVSVDVIGPYLRPQHAIAEHSIRLEAFLKWCRGSTAFIQTTQAIMDIIQMPANQLSTKQDLNNYHVFVEGILGHNDLRSISGSLLFPDTRGRLHEPSSLYDHNKHLFIAVMRYLPEPPFLHPDFRDLTNQVYPLGIKHDVDVETFSHCIDLFENALHSVDYEDEHTHATQVSEMAEAIYYAYRTNLIAVIETDTDQWKTLDDRPFISRRDVRRPTLPRYDCDQYCEPLDNILAPSQFVRDDLEAICWTQRALFKQNPSPHLSAVHPSLGVPSANEVVAHLRILASRIAMEWPSERTIISDLQTTYQWLEKHSEDAKAVLASLVDVAIFLNVDDPWTELWDGKWLPARSIVLNLKRDSRGSSKVNRFLAPYPNLLRNAGCQNLDTMSDNRVSAAANRVRITSDDTIPRSSFNEMRLDGDLTDVRLAPDDGENSEPDSLRAHKAFLFVTIPHIKNMYIFDGSLNDEEYIVPDSSYFVLKAILDFVYTGTLCVEPEDELEIDERGAFLQNLLHLLRKVDEWGMEDMKTKVEVVIMEKVENWQLFEHVEDVASSAIEANSKRLESWMDLLKARHSFLFQ